MAWIAQVKAFSSVGGCVSTGDKLFPKLFHQLSTGCHAKAKMIILYSLKWEKNTFTAKLLGSTFKTYIHFVLFFQSILEALLSNTLKQGRLAEGNECLNPSLFVSPPRLALGNKFIHMSASLQHFFVCLFHHVACEILVPWRGIESESLHWKCGVLTTGLLRKSWIHFIKKKKKKS